MIISHAHRFIFIKTEKTAGTSLEIALSRYCGSDDITPFWEEDEVVQRRHRAHRAYVGGLERASLGWPGAASGRRPPSSPVRSSPAR